MPTPYEILGVSPQATINEIKQAYRKKAKLLHPDRNKAPDANEQFIALNTAYDELIDIKSGKKTYRTHTKSYSRPQESYEEILKRKREEARRRAQEHARMRYEAYIKTDHYKNTQAVKSILNHIYFLISVILILQPLWFFFIKGIDGLLIGTLTTLVTSPIWAGGIFVMRKKVDFSEFKGSLIRISKTKRFQLIVLILINLIFTNKFLFNTVIHNYLILVLIVFGILVEIYLSRIKRKTKPFAFILSLVTIINMMAWINYNFSSYSHSEAYYYNEDGQSLILDYYLTPNYKITAYNNYTFIRTRFQYAPQGTEQIILNIHNGLLGFKVVKAYGFK